MTLASGVYSGLEWSAGPGAVYALLAEALLADVDDLAGRVALDIGAGTGAVSTVLAARRARVVALDRSDSMLHWQRTARPPAVVGDACTLPVRTASVDLVTAGFCFNHLADPRPALNESARVLRPGGSLLASTWPAEADPVKTVCEQVLRRHGWTAPDWYDDLRASNQRTADPAYLLESATAVGLDATTTVVSVPLVLATEALVAWRTGVPHTTGWLQALLPARRDAVIGDLSQALNDTDQPWTVRMLVLSARRVK